MLFKCAKDDRFTFIDHETAFGPQFLQFKPVVDRHEVGIFADGDFAFILEAEGPS